jgi:hypothetical protein
MQDNSEIVEKLNNVLINSGYQIDTTKFLAAIQESMVANVDTDKEIDEDNNMQKVDVNITASDTKEELTKKILDLGTGKGEPIAIAEALKKLIDDVAKIKSDIYESVDGEAEKEAEAPAEAAKEAEAPEAEKVDEQWAHEDPKETAPARADFPMAPGQAGAPSDIPNSAWANEDPKETAPAKANIKGGEAAKEDPMKGCVQESAEGEEAAAPEAEAKAEEAAPAEEAKAEEQVAESKKCDCGKCPACKAEEEAKKDGKCPGNKEEKGKDEAIKEDAEDAEKAEAEEAKAEEAKEEAAEPVKEEAEAAPEAEKEEAPAEAKEEEAPKAEEAEPVKEAAEEAEVADPTEVDVENVPDYKLMYENQKAEIEEALSLIQELTDTFNELGKVHKEVVVESEERISKLGKELDSYKLSGKFNITIDEATEMLTSKTYDEVVEELTAAEAKKEESEAEEKAEAIKESLEQAKTESPVVRRKVFSIFESAPEEKAEEVITESVEATPKKLTRKVFSCFGE